MLNIYSVKKVILATFLVLVSLSSLMPLANAEMVGLGIDTTINVKTYSGDADKTTSVTIEYTYGDTSDFLVREEIRSVKWDEMGIIVSSVKYHKIGIQDDYGRIVASFLDSAVGGVAKKGLYNVYKWDGPECPLGTPPAYTSTSNNADTLARISPPSPSACTITEKVIIKDLFKKFNKYIIGTVTVELVFYIEASTEAEAKAKVGADLGFVGAEFTVKSIVKVGTVYKVDVTATFKYGGAYMSYVAEMKYEYMTSSGYYYSGEPIQREALASVSGYVLPSGW